MTIPPRMMSSLSAVILACGFAVPAMAADAPWSIERFNASQDQWPQLLSGTLRVEGRLSSQIKGQLRFQKCDFTFRLPPDLERRIATSKNLEVAGVLRHEGNRYYFDITDLKPQPTDKEQFHAREVALRNPTPAELYELGEWAVKRGRFYDDAELIELGQTLEVRAVAVELSHLPKGDYTARFQLLDRAVAGKFPAAVVGEIRHEAFRDWLVHCLQNTPPDGEQLAALEARLKQQLPEALEPLSAWPTELTQAYGLDPLETYRQADANQRKLLHRLLGAEVQWQRIMLTAVKDGSNGGQVAARIDALIPERHAAAEQFRERELLYRMRGIDAAPRAEALALAAAFRDRQRPQQAAEALLKWLVAKERKQRPEEAPEFIALADDYLTLLGDESRAVALLSEAHRREPQSADVLERFAKLGYEFDGIRWKKPSNPEPADTPPSPTGPPTQLVAGMSPAQLDQLLGKPSSVTVIRAAAATDEIRVYGRAGEGSRLVVHLHRGPGDPHPLVTRFYSR
jgi:hypothetical protein